MRIIRIFLLQSQQVFHHRLRSLVWFFIPLLNNLTLILFWSRALPHTSANHTWNMTSATTYYFLLSLANSMLVSHIEESIAFFDIQQGELTQYLTRPFPYFWMKFIEEIPYRLLQGGYGVILISCSMLLFGQHIQISSNPVTIMLTFVIAILAYITSFVIKMNMGLMTFWFIDSRAFFELLTIITIVLSGGIIPLSMFPSVLQNIALSLPFAYTAYIPIIALQGQLSIYAMLQAMGIQCVWIGILIGMNRRMWSAGIKQFTAFGQ